MNNKFLSIAVTIISTIVIMVSCNKYPSPEINNKEVDSYSKMITQRINNFHNLMEYGYKTGGTMPLDSVVWNLEALITNYGAYPDSASQNFVLKVAHFTLAVDANNNAANSDVQALYQRMIDTINVQLAGINSDVKFLAFSDVQKDSVVGNTAYLTTNNGYGFNLILGIYEPFDDNWIWGTLSNPDAPPYPGNCDQTDFSSDGSNEIEYRLNHPVVVSSGTAYTDLETRNTNGQYFLDNNGNPRLYWDNSMNLYHCMNNQELTDNLINAHDIINTYDDIDPNTGEPLGLRPHGKDFVRVNIIDDVIVYSNSGAYLHNYEVTYGIPFMISQ